MMRSKPSLRNLINPALLCSALIIFFLSGCDTDFPSLYKNKEIPSVVKKICKDEYNLDVSASMASNTLWIYAPVKKILHSDFGISEDKFFDDDMLDKGRNIMTTIGRVLLNTDKTPEFFALVITDINLGLDYMIIGNVEDVKKTYATLIPGAESNRRYVIKLSANNLAIGDITGTHIKIYNIDLGDFLAQQIAQRIMIRFQEDSLKKFFKAIKVEGNFRNKKFVINYQIILFKKPPKPVNIEREMLTIVGYCLKSYEFNTFKGVELNDMTDGSRIKFSKAAVFSRANDLEP